LTTQPSARREGLVDVHTVRAGEIHRPGEIDAAQIRADQIDAGEIAPPAIEKSGG